MKKSIVLALALCLLATTAVPAAEWVIKLGHVANEQHSWQKAALLFKDRVEKQTGGRVQVEVYPNSELGTEAEVIDAIYSGVAHMNVTADTMSNWVPEIVLLSIPYMIRDNDHMLRILDSEVGQFLETQLIEKASMRPLSVFIRSPRNVTSNKPITTPADMEGFKLRLPNVPLHILAWQSIGAKPIPMAFAEVFTSIQQKVIDGQENPPDLIMSGSLYEVQKYMIKTEHVRTWCYLVIGEEFFQSLPKDIQKILIDAGKEAEAYERKIHLEDEGKCLEFLKSKGMIFHEADKEAFAKAMYDDVLKALSPKLQELYKKALDM